MAYKDSEEKKRKAHEYYLRTKEHKAQLKVLRRAHDNEVARQKRKGPQGDEVRAYHNQWLQTNGLRARIIKALGGKCVQCGFNDYLALQIDHINGGGNQEQKMFKNSYQYLKYVQANLDTGKYQVLCANCNMVKRGREQESRWRYTQKGIEPSEPWSTLWNE